MSQLRKPYGPVMQIAYVVDDLSSAIEHWVETIGVGPFFVLEGTHFDNSHYLGRPLELNMTAALAYSADLQIELIQQHDDTPSIFTQRRPQVGSVHHLASLTSDLEASLSWLKKRGGTVLQGADIPGGGRIAYVEVDGNAGIFELAELTAATLGLFRLIRQAGEHWDGQQQLLKL